MKKHIAKQIAMERIILLINNALHEAKSNNDLADNQAKLAKKIAMRMRLRLPYEFRQLYCKRCKQFILPGKSSRIRTGGSKLKAIRITCLECGHIYRKVLAAK